MLDHLLDPIVAADKAEEDSAAEELQSARSVDELTGIWWRSCDGFEGAARERLQEVYGAELRRLGPGVA